MNKYYFKTGVIIFVILLSISALVVYLAIKDNYKRVDNYDNLVQVKDYNTFFAVTNNIVNYLNATRDVKTDQLYMLLDKKYLDRNRVTKKNVHKKVPAYEEETTMKVENMQMYIRDDGNCIYYATGVLYVDEYLNTRIIDENYSIIVIIDYNNYTTSIYPVSDNPIDDINSILSIDIKKNKYNGMKTTNLISTENICSLYYTDYIMKLYNSVEKAYNITDTSLSSEEFKNYISENMEEFNSAIVNCEYDNDSNTYIINDSNNNYFKFMESSVMNYRVYFEIR